MKRLRGNQRACVVSEPLWAVPYQLFLPFASLYMAALGLSEGQIGTVASLALFLEFVWAMLSGAIVDKYGRRRTMLVFGLLAWSIPCAVWAMAQGYAWFAVAVLFNSMWRVTGTSFSCMIIEDGDDALLVNIYTLLNITGIVAGFLTPIAGLFIDRYTLVPTMRVIYFLSVILMTIKHIVQYRMGSESTTGRRRMEETKDQSILRLSAESWPVLVNALRDRRLLLGVLMVVLLTAFNTIQGTFWPLFVTEGYGISDSRYALIPLARTLINLAAYLFVVPRVRIDRIKQPLLVGFGALGVGILLLLLMLPTGQQAVVFIVAAIEAFGIALLGPVTESVMSLLIPSVERARVVSMVVAVQLLVSTPITWIAGQLAERNRAFPLVLNLGIVLIELLIAVRLPRRVEAGRLA